MCVQSVQIWSFFFFKEAGPIGVWCKCDVETWSLQQSNTENGSYSEGGDFLCPAVTLANWKSLHFQIFWGRTGSFLRLREELYCLYIHSLCSFPSAMTVKSAAIFGFAVLLCDLTAAVKFWMFTYNTVFLTMGISTFMWIVFYILDFHL